MSDASQERPQDSTPSPFWKWLLISAAFTAMLAIAAAHVPGKAAIVCRFAPMFGFVVGAVIGLITGQGRPPGYQVRLTAIAILAALGFVGLTFESHRLYKIELQKLINNGVGPNLLPPQMIDDMQKARAEVIAVRSHFNVYLRYRVMENQLVGDKAWPGTTAAYFWAVEIFLAALVAAVSFYYFTRPPLFPRERDSFKAEGADAG